MGRAELDTWTRVQYVLVAKETQDLRCAISLLESEIDLQVTSG